MFYLVTLTRLLVHSTTRHLRKCKIAHGGWHGLSFFNWDARFTLDSNPIRSLAWLAWSCSTYTTVDNWKKAVILYHGNLMIFFNLIYLLMYVLIQNIELICNCLFNWCRDNLSIISFVSLYNMWFSLSNYWRDALYWLTRDSHSTKPDTKHRLWPALRDILPSYQVWGPG